MALIGLFYAGLLAAALIIEWRARHEHHRKREGILHVEPGQHRTADKPLDRRS